jgi:phage gpG-like protein
MTISLIGFLAAKRALADASEKRLKTATTQALRNEAQLLRRTIVEGIRRQAPGKKRFRPLSPVTLKKRRKAGFSGDKALIVTGDLRNSIEVKKAGDDDGVESQFVGIPHNLQARDGMQLSFRGAIHEFGVNKGRVRIPSRSFLQTSFEFWQKGFPRRMEARIARFVGGAWGIKPPLPPKSLY